MKHQTARERLAQHAGKEALFVSDPVNGDHFVIGPKEQLTQLQAHFEDSQFSTIDELLATLDFGTYEGSDPIITIL